MADTYLQRWSPELRRAVMKVRPEYFAWPAADQEQYRVSIPTEDVDSLSQALKEELGLPLGTAGEAVQAERSLVDDQLTEDQLSRFNEAVLPLWGIGEDSFFLHEFLPEGRTILDYDTLRAYDEEHHRLQERARKEEDAGYREEIYRGSLYMRWARLFVDNRFAYANLSMAAGHIYSRIRLEADALVQKLISYKLVPGPANEKAVSNHLFRWDTHYHAAGKETLLDELKHCTYRYAVARSDALAADWDGAKRAGAYILRDVSRPREASFDFVFTDKETLGAVRFHSFLRDCRSLQRETDELMSAIAEEKYRLDVYLRAEHDELLRRSPRTR